MKVFVNKFISIEKPAWLFRSNSSAKRLFLWNNTGHKGSCFNGVSLGFKKIGRSYHISINKPLKRPSSKTVGIYISETGEFEAWENQSSIFSGKSIGGLVTGFVGIYKIGSVVRDSGLFYKLTEKGWELTSHIIG